jgi:hypothetical protein
MSELDHLREEVAYLKFWLGIVGIVVLNRLTERRISRIKDL